jgi:hypothetical protein
MERRLARLEPSVVEVAKTLAVLDGSAGIAKVADVARLDTTTTVIGALALGLDGITTDDEASRVA